jgi:hypothetical protein
MRKQASLPSLSLSAREFHRPQTHPATVIGTRAHVRDTLHLSHLAWGRHGLRRLVSRVTRRRLGRQFRTWARLLGGARSLTGAGGPSVSYRDSIVIQLAELQCPPSDSACTEGRTDRRMDGRLSVHRTSRRDAALMRLQPGSAKIPVNKFTDLDTRQSLSCNDMLKR